MNYILQTKARANDGYILLETIVAVIILSLSIVGIQSAMQQTLQMRGRSEDLTHARFLLEKTLAEIALRPRVEESSVGNYMPLFELADPEDYSRFHISYDIQRVPINAAYDIPNLSPDLCVNKYFMVRIHVEVTWTRGETEYTEHMETLLDAKRLFLDCS